MLGEPERKTFTLTYDILTENSTESQKLKIEINTREHFSVFGFQQHEKYE
ncbi:MAG: hypothetical protein ACD_45C00598G0003 [uncultured bacterium]|nr:MAG: hypothetical protein ACD_45C00598G0003 [uncultured bacterium]